VCKVQRLPRSALAASSGLQARTTRSARSSPPLSTLPSAVGVRKSDCFAHTANRYPPSLRRPVLALRWSSFAVSSASEGGFYCPERVTDDERRSRGFDFAIPSLSARNIMTTRLQKPPSLRRSSMALHRSVSARVMLAAGATAFEGHHRGFDDLRQFVKGGGDFAKEVAAAMHERAELEANYAKGLAKVSAKLFKAAKDREGGE